MRRLSQGGSEDTKREYTDFEVSEREQQLSCISKAGTLHQLSLSSQAAAAAAPPGGSVAQAAAGGLSGSVNFDGATTLANLVAIKEIDVERLRFFSYASPSAKQTLLSEKEGTLVKWIMIPTELYVIALLLISSLLLLTCALFLCERILAHHVFFSFVSSRVPEVHFELELPEVGLVDRIDMVLGYTGLFDLEEKEDWPKCSLAVSSHAHTHIKRNQRSYEHCDMITCRHTTCTRAQSTHTATNTIVRFPWKNAHSL